jgi:glycosyltransferase involved in cell wall biosynthesis
LYDIIQPACGDQYSLSIAPGALSHEEMREFYNNIDVLVVASTHEGEPLTLLEAMACGCYPVCVNVGVVPELINDYSNGIIVQERTIDSFREGFAWCESNLEKIRAAGAQNAELVQQTRNWDLCAEQFRMVFRSALAHASDHCS